jgi:serine/threonine protein kinase
MASSDSKSDAPRFPAPFGSKYLLLDRISAGGMSEVYRANAVGPDGFARAVAIKRILPHLSSDGNFTTMFIDEAKISARLHHPSICQIYDFGRIEDAYFLAMEHVEGQSLREIKRRFEERKIKVPQALVLCILSELCDALDYAHNLTERDGRPLGIVHRDIKPRNVLISYQGEVKLIDFGIAKASHRLSATRGSIKGTFSYMAPEQVTSGCEVDHRADIFAVGLILHELLTGQRVYPRGADPSMIDVVREARIQPPSTIRRSITGKMDEIVMRAVAPDRAQRYQRASELKADIEAFRLYWGQLYSRTDIASMMEELFAREIEQSRAREARRTAMELPSAQDNTITFATESVLDPSVGASGNKLYATISGEPPGSVTLSPPTTTTAPPARRIWVVLAVGLFALMGGVAAAAYAVGVIQGDRPAADQALPATLQIASTPDGARVTVRREGQILVQARTPLTVGGMVAGRRYLIRAELEGHVTLERELVWGAGSNPAIRLKLTRLP